MMSLVVKKKKYVDDIHVQVRVTHTLGLVNGLLEGKPCPSR